VKPSFTRAEFCTKFGLSPDDRIVVLLPGSRHGEVERHMPYLLDAAARIRSRHQVQFILALPPGFSLEHSIFWEPLRSASIQVIEGLTWDCLAQAEVGLAASGTVTIEAALLGTPMVSFYRVNALSWMLGRWMVRAPFLSMVNLVAGRQVVPELIQGEMTGAGIADGAGRLLDDEKARTAMRADLGKVAAQLATSHDPMESAAEWVEKVLQGEMAHAK
jgi:lipid-A-disaccharide synthase